MSETARVVAVVVTWNRKELLARNLRAVLAQTRSVDEILVVDNASTDGTPEMLAAEFPTVRVVRLAGNAGAAGGMHVGAREGLALGADWLWLMDDDGVPAATCLAEQLRVAEKNNFALCGPLLLDIENPSVLAFAPSERTQSRVVNELRDHLPGDSFETLVAGLWNGTLISATAIHDVGFPKAEMFIWGEESEFTHRLASAGFRIGVAVRAEYLHPRDRFPACWLSDLLFNWQTVKKCRFCNPRSPRSLIYARNLGFNDARYHGSTRVIARLLGGILMWARHQGPRGALAFVRYYVDGATDRYRLAPSRDEILSRVATEQSG